MAVLKLNIWYILAIYLLTNIDHTSSRAVQENSVNEGPFTDTANFTAQQLEDSFSEALSQQNEKSAIDSFTYNLERITYEFGSADFFDILLNLFLESNEQRFRELQKRVEESGDDIQSIIKLINSEIGTTLIVIDGDNVTISATGLSEIVQNLVTTFTREEFQDNVFLQQTLTKIVLEQVNNSVPLVKNFLDDKTIPLKDLQIALAATSISRSKRDVNIFGTLIEFVRTILRTLLSPIQSIFNTLLNTVDSFILSLYVENESLNVLLQFITNITNNVVTTASQLVTGLQAFVNNIFDNILYDGNTNSTTTDTVTTDNNTNSTTTDTITNDNNNSTTTDTVTNDNNNNSTTTDSVTTVSTTAATTTVGEATARKRRDVSFYEIDYDIIGQYRTVKRLKREIDIFGTIIDVIRSALVPIFSNIQLTINSFLDGVSNFVLTFYITTEPDNEILKLISNITNNIIISAAEWITSLQDFSNSVFDNILYGNGTSTTTVSTSTSSSTVDASAASEASARKRRSVFFYEGDTFEAASRSLIRLKREIDIIGTVLDFFRSLITPFVSQIQTIITSIFDSVSNFILRFYVATEPDNFILQTITNITNQVVLKIAEFLVNGENFVNAVFDNIIWGNGTWSETTSTTASSTVTTEISPTNDTARKIDDNSDDSLTKSSRDLGNIFTNITSWINNFLKSIITNLLSNSYESIGKLITYPVRYIAETVIDFVFSCASNCTSIL